MYKKTGSSYSTLPNRGGKMNGRVVGGCWEDSGRGGLCRGAPLLARGISGTGLYCLREVRSLFEFEWHVGIPLESLPENRSLSRFQSGNSVFLSAATGISGFLSRFN